MASRNDLLDAIEHETGDGKVADGVLERLQQLLAADPALIEQLAPGMLLSRRAMTPKERGALAIPVMNAARKQYREEMIAALAPVIANTRRLKADASVQELVIALNATSYGPAKTRRTWTYVDVKRLLKEIDR